MHSGKQKPSKNPSWVPDLLDKLLPAQLEKKTLISVIIPTYNCADRIGATLDSLQKQDYSEIEVIILDAGSTDRTLNIINSYNFLISRVYSVTKFRPFEMLNRGLLLARGEYVTFLFPGTIYISKSAFTGFDEIIQKEKPELIYCGSLEREGQRQPRMIFRTLQKDLLEKGKQPTTLSACFFSMELFDRLGKFDSRFQVRGLYEYLARFLLSNEFRSHKIERVYVDFDFGEFSYVKWVRYAVETGQILAIHFGLLKSISWFLGLNYLSFLKFWLRSKKEVIADKV